MDEIFVDDDGDIFIEEPEPTYDAELVTEEGGLVEVDLKEEAEVCLDPIPDSTKLLLEHMVDVLNRNHDDYLKTATEAEILDRRTGTKVSPKFELEFLRGDDIVDHEATVALHDMEAEESEYGDSVVITERILSICYFNGYHKDSTGV